jgi:hypothetical protein
MNDFFDDAAFPGDSIMTADEAASPSEDPTASDRAVLVSEFPEFFENGFFDSVSGVIGIDAETMAVGHSTIRTCIEAVKDSRGERPAGPGILFPNADPTGIGKSYASDMGMVLSAAWAAFLHLSSCRRVDHPATFLNLLPLKGSRDESANRMRGTISKLPASLRERIELVVLPSYGDAFDDLLTAWRRPRGKTVAAELAWRSSCPMVRLARKELRISPAAEKKARNGIERIQDARKKAVGDGEGGEWFSGERRHIRENFCFKIIAMLPSAKDARPCSSCPAMNQAGALRDRVPDCRIVSATHAKAHYPMDGFEVRRGPSGVEFDQIKVTLHPDAAGESADVLPSSAMIIDEAPRYRESSWRAILSNASEFDAMEVALTLNADRTSVGDEFERTARRNFTEIGINFPPDFPDELGRQVDKWFSDLDSHRLLVDGKRTNMKESGAFRATIDDCGINGLQRADSSSACYAHLFRTSSRLRYSGQTRGSTLRVSLSSSKSGNEDESVSDLFFPAFGPLVRSGYYGVGKMLKALGRAMVRAANATFGGTDSRRVKMAADNSISQALNALLQPANGNGDNVAIRAFRRISVFGRGKIDVGDDSVDPALRGLSLSDRFYGTGFSCMYVKPMERSGSNSIQHLVVERTPESILAGTAKSGISVALISATVAVSSPICSINLDFVSRASGARLARRGAALDAMVARRIETKYGGRGAGDIRTTIPSVGLLSDVAAIAAEDPARPLVLDERVAEFLTDFRIDDGQKFKDLTKLGDDSALNSFAAFLDDVLADSVPDEARPGRLKLARPRVCLVMSMSKSDVASLEKLFVRFVRSFLDDKVRAEDCSAFLDAAGLMATIDESESPIDARDEASSEGDALDEEAIDAVESNLSRILSKASRRISGEEAERPPIFVIFASYATCATGLNLVLKASSGAIASSNETLSSYLGRDPSSLVLDGDGGAKLDLSDIVLARPSTNIVPPAGGDGKNVDEKNYKTFVHIMAAIGCLPPNSLTGSLSGENGARDRLAGRFRGTEHYDLYQYELAKQAIGRCERSPNAPNSIGIFVSPSMARSLACVAENAELPELRSFQSPTFEKVLDACVVASASDPRLLLTRCSGAEWFGRLATIGFPETGDDETREAEKEEARLAYAALRKAISERQTVVASSFSVPNQEFADAEAAIGAPPAGRRSFWFSADAGSLDCPITLRGDLLQCYVSTSADGVALWRSRPQGTPCFRLSWKISLATRTAWLEARRKGTRKEFLLLHPDAMREIAIPFGQERMLRRQAADALHCRIGDPAGKLYELADHHAVLEGASGSCDLFMDNKGWSESRLTVAGFEELTRRAIAKLERLSERSPSPLRRPKLLYVLSACPSGCDLTRPILLNAAGEGVARDEGFSIGFVHLPTDRNFDVLPLERIGDRIRNVELGGRRTMDDDDGETTDANADDENAHGARP